MDHRPKARTEGVVSERIDAELVIYDQHSQRAHCLSADAVSVWERCDGNLSEAQIAHQLALSPAVVERAVTALHECGLLDDGPIGEQGYSRREAAFRMAKIGGAALAAPLVFTVDVGTAAAAASHLAAGCPVTTCGSCTGTAGCSLCTSAGATSTNSVCASGRCYCSLVNSTGGLTTTLRCAVGATCHGDAATGCAGGATGPCGCTTAGQCCGNSCVSNNCRSAFTTC